MTIKPNNQILFPKYEELEWASMNDTTKKRTFRVVTLEKAFINCRYAYSTYGNETVYYDYLVYIDYSLLTILSKNSAEPEGGACIRGTTTVLVQVML